MDALANLLVGFHARHGDAPFIILMSVLGIVLAFWAIPKSTDLMVNCAAGLAGKYLGNKRRTLVINASTNNPEAFSMASSFAMGRLGGIANPLGSLFANFYLLFVLAFLTALFRMTLRREFAQIRRLFGVVGQMKWIILLHLILTLGTFAAGTWALRLITHRGAGPGVLDWKIAAGAAILACGIALFVLAEKRLKRRRPDLFEDIDASDHRPSWWGFILGSAAVIVCCWVMNIGFVAASVVYSDELTATFGPLVFLWLHWTLGALITSLPEFTVSVRNYERATAPDVHTAVGSASYSNMVNLAIALIGVAAWATAATLGGNLTW